MAATSAAVVFGAVVFGAAQRQELPAEPGGLLPRPVLLLLSLRPSGSLAASASKPSSSSASGRAFSTESNSARAAAATSVELGAELGQLGVRARAGTPRAARSRPTRRPRRGPGRRTARAAAAGCPRTGPRLRAAASGPLSPGRDGVGARRRRDPPPKASAPGPHRAASSAGSRRSRGTARARRPSASPAAPADLRPERVVLPRALVDVVDRVLLLEVGLFRVRRRRRREPAGTLGGCLGRSRGVSATAYVASSRATTSLLVGMGAASREHQRPGT